MNIYDKSGSKKLDVLVTRQAKHEEEMMRSNFVQLSWNATTKTELEAGTYIIPFNDGVKYRLLDRYQPKQERENKFVYTPQFQHPIMILDKIPFILVTGNTTSFQVAEKETDWSYTGTANTILQRIVDMINIIGREIDDIGTGWVVIIDSDLSGSKTCTFSSTSVMGGVTECANQWNCEYHFDYENKILYFGKVVIGDAVTLKVGENIGVPSINTTTQQYYNAYIVKGSARNISQKSTSGSNVSVNRRLTLDPAKYPYGYIDLRTDKSEPLMLGEIILDDIYPSLDLYVYDARCRTRNLLDDDGEVVTDINGRLQKYAVWYVRLAYFYNGQWTDYVVTDDQLIDGLDLSISFQANEEDGALPSPLAGRDFGLTFHKQGQDIPANEEDGDSGVIIKAGDYEIIFEDGNPIVPTTVDGELYPRGGETPSLLANRVFLYNVAMSDAYKKQAYYNLEQEGLKEIARLRSDLNNYTFQSNAPVFEDNRTNPNLSVGQKVLYDDGHGYSYETRVMKLVTQIDKPYQQTITIGNEQIKGTNTKIREDIQRILTGGGTSGDGSTIGGSVSYLKNLISAYGKAYFLSKTTDDTASGLIGFLKGLWVKAKGLFGIDENGNARVNDINVAGDANFEGFLQAVKAMMNQISSLNYTGGDFGTGFTLTNDRNGHSYLAVDELYVRMKAIFNELEIKKRTYCGGNFIFSPAGSKLYRVDYINASGETIGYAEYNVPWVFNGEAITLNDIAYAARQKVRVEVDLSSVATYRCYIVSDDGSTTIENLWQAYDQAMCQTFDVNTTERELSNEVERKTGNIFYWRLVTGIGTSILDDGKEYAYVDLSNTNPGVSGGYLPTGPNGADADFPCAGDVIVCMGHRGSDADGSGVERMNVIEVETVGDDAPAIKEYRGINTFSLEGKRKTMISPKSGNEFYATRFYTETDYSEPVPNTVERGIWQQYDAQGQPMKYYNFNLVSHKGTTWLCIVEDGFYTADGTYTFTDIEGKTWDIPYNKGDRIFTCLEPSDANNTVWQKHTWKGASSYKSTVFIRQNTVPSAPTAAETTVNGIKYNTYDHPVPPPSSGWTDGTPDGEAILWAVTRIFTTDGSEPQQASWSTPRPMTDTADFDVEFSSYENPSAPSGHPNTNSQWSNTANSSTIWMATSEKHNGVWGAWQISKIKGESGIDAAVASLSHSVISIQCDNSGKALASGSEDVYVYLSTKGSDLTGINHSVSGSTSATYRKLGGNRFRLSWSSGDSISDGTLTVTVTGTDSNGNSQSGYASIRVVAEKQGIKGTDAYSVNATPAALIFTQSETAPYGLVDASKSCNINVIQGTQRITTGITITKMGTSGCEQSVSGTTLTITPTRSGNTTDGYTYPETGYADFRVTVGGMYYDIRIQFYCNLLGTWKQSVETGTETIVAKKISYVVNDGDDSKTITQSTATFNSVRDATNSLQEWKVNETDGYVYDKTYTNTRIDNAFEAVQELREEVDGELQNYSTIQQTANSISLSVTNLKNEVKTNTGIDITNGTIDLIAGKVNFKASNGTSVNPYMSIGQDGKLTVKSVKATDGEFSGKVTATEGEIGGWKINGNTLQSENKASIILNGDGNSFARIQPMSDRQPALSIRNDRGTAASFSAYTDNSIGIDVIAQSGYNTKAIHSSGNVEFNIRQGETARFMSEGNKGTVQFDIPITFGSTPTLLYSTGTVNLPSSPVDGQFVFIKASRVYTPNKVYSNEGLTDVWIEANNSRDIGGASLIMVYSQSLESWIMFWCGWND